MRHTGQERFRSLAKVFYNNANVAILTYGITSRKSFDTLSHWIKEIEEHGPADIILAVVGNKEDLVEIEAVDV